MNKKSLVFTLITLISAALYANTLKNGFVYDDEAMIAQNILISDMNNIWKLFGKEYLDLSAEKSYRPVVTFTYFLDYMLYGLKPWGYHLTNVLLHSVNGILLYMFLTLLYYNSVRESGIKSQGFTTWPLVVTLLFVTHPVLTEAVNAISFREDSLTTTFYLSTLILYIRHPRPAIHLVSYITYFLALLSKEMAITLPFMVYCYERIYGDKKGIPNRHIVGYTVVTLIYTYFRFYYFYNPYEDFATWRISERFLTVPWLLLNYLKLTIFPVSLSADYEIAPIGSLSSTSFIVSLVTFIILLSVVFSTREREAAFGILFFTITLIPVYNVIPIYNPFAERYLYLPTIGLLILSGPIHRTCLTSKHKVRYIYIMSLLITLSLYSVLTMKRNTIWRDNYTLWSYTAKKMPQNSRSHNILGTIYADQGRIYEAIEEVKSALMLRPDYADAHYNLGTIYAGMGRFDEAIQEYQEALRLNTRYAAAHFGIGIIYEKMGRIDGAMQEYRNALRISPNYSIAYHRLGNIYYQQGRFDEAKTNYLNALQINPNNPDFHNSLANTYYKLGIFDEAIDGYKKAIRLDPLDHGYYYNLGNVYDAQGRLDDAVVEYRKALRLRPDFATARISLEIALKRIQDQRGTPPIRFSQ
jgi:tetratricopeptide (TPR) repeat protein